MTTAVVSPGAASASRRERHYLGLTRPRAIMFALLLAFVALAPMFIYPILLMKMYCFIIFAFAYNLLLGYTGLMSFGHAAFFGLGAYTAGWMALNTGLTSELSVFSGAVIGGIAGAVFGWIAIRRSGLYFAMITLALAQMVYFFALKAPVTRGEDGMQSIPRGSLVGIIPLQSDTSLYITVAAAMLLALLLYNRIIHSPFGQVLRAVRNNPERVESLGYSVNRFKLISFIISAAIAGFAGGLKAIVFGIATLTDIALVTTTEVVLITLVGGIGTIFGPVFGAIFVLYIEFFLAPYGPYLLVFQGLVFMGFVLVFRQGLVGALQKWLKVQL